MAPTKKNSGRKARARRGRGVARGRKSGVSSAVKSYVAKAIAVNVENKTCNANYAGAFGNAVANPSLYAYPMTPYTSYMTIGQGVQQNQRIGNSVKVKKAILRYILRPMPYNVDSNPFPAPVQVELYLGRTKLCGGDLPTSGDMVTLFQNGNTSFAPVGNLNDLISETNKDYWHIAKRWSHKVGTADSYGTGSVASTQYFANNDFKLNIVRRMDITKYYPKTLKFNDSTNQVQGNGLFLFYQCLNAGGGTNASTVLPCHITFWIDVRYEDA